TFPTDSCSGLVLPDSQSRFRAQGARILAGTARPIRPEHRGQAWKGAVRSPPPPPPPADVARRGREVWLPYALVNGGRGPAASRAPATGGPLLELNGERGGTLQQLRQQQ